MANAYRTTTLGYPRVGPGRAYKWMLEDYWAGKTAAADCDTTPKPELVATTAAAQFLAAAPCGPDGQPLAPAVADRAGAR